MDMQYINLINKNQTVNEIVRISKKYCDDLKKSIVYFKGEYKRVSDLPFLNFFEFVKKIRYVKDVSPVEIVLRPEIILQNITMGADCKKKTVLCCCYFELNKIDYRLIGSSKKQDGKIHHIFPQIFFNDSWINFDATYNHFKFGEPKTVTKAIILYDSKTNNVRR